MNKDFPQFRFCSAHIIPNEDCKLCHIGTSMTIEELLEALPYTIDGRELDIYKQEYWWEVSYSSHESGSRFIHRGTLRTALEGVYSDLVANKLIKPCEEATKKNTL